MDKIKLVYIVSEIGKALAFEWITEELNADKFDLSFILINPINDSLHDFLIAHKVPVLVLYAKSKKDWPGAIMKIYRELKYRKADIVHCHLKDATTLGLIAAKMAGIPARIYTRHHSSLHHIYFPKGVWFDKLNNKLATHIISISGLVKKILIEWEGAPENKITLVPHGFRLEDFERRDEQKISALKEKYNPTGKAPVVGVISRFVEWKGVQYVVPAFKKLLQKYPDALLLLFNAHGDYEHVINEQLKELPQESYKAVRFEPEISSVYKMLDIFIHAPIRDHDEAFGQIYVEALAAGVPSVFTLSGIAPDFIEDKKNAVVVPFMNADAVYEAMNVLLSDKELSAAVARGGKESVQGAFSLNRMMKNLEQLYVQSVH
ncbi:MAG: glycosyltransferase family 1 protein [Sphingobacteriales bacterium]|nr:MAG: glycosyltransferase family 1 protein [Sphingobacteriales bacterium]